MSYSSQQQSLGGETAPAVVVDKPKRFNGGVRNGLTIALVMAFLGGVTFTIQSMASTGVRLDHQGEVQDQLVETLQEQGTSIDALVDELRAGIGQREKLNAEFDKAIKLLERLRERADNHTHNSP